MKKRLSKLLVAMLACVTMSAAFTACDLLGGNSNSTSGESSNSESTVTESVILDKTTATIDLYETLSLSATLENLTGDVVWSSSDATKATVVDGVVTSLAEGEVTITATVGKISASCVVTIASSGQLPVFTLNSESLSLKQGQDFTVAPALNYKGQTLEATFSYTSADPTIATVENGKITAVSSGNTTVTVMVSYLGYQDAKEITVNVTANVLMETSVNEVVLGTIEVADYVTSATVTATVSEDGATVENPTIVWATSNEAVATVTNGLITSVSAGEATITATYTSTSGEAFVVNVKVTVEKPVISAELTNNLVNIDADESETVELNLNGIQEEIANLVKIVDKSNDNAEVVYMVVDGKVMLNKSNLTVSKRIFLVEYTNSIYEVTVFITSERVTLVNFASEKDLESIGFFWEGPQTMEFNTDVAYEDEAGSVKFTYTQEQNWNYFLLKAPLVTDISLYDYIEFSIYNPTTHAFVIQPTWGTGVTIAANGWTTARFLLSEFAAGKITDMAGTPLSAGNITNLPFCFYGDGFVADECFYLSSIYAGKFEPVVEEVAENVVAKFSEDSDLTNVSSFWSHVYGLSIDTETVYGEEKGSLKATVGTPNGNGYLILNTPRLTDVSGYDYIAFWVYNAGQADVNIGTLWNATPAKVGEWTQFKFTAETLNSTEDMNGNKLTTSNITNFVIWITGGDALAAGDALYFSYVTAGKNAVVEEEVAENVVAKFESEADLSSVESYWPTVYVLSIDTETVYGEEKGSLKATVGELNANGYISVTNPINKNVSKYDYVSFWVYNSGAVDIEVGTLWKGYPVKAGQWTEVKIDASVLNGADTMFSTKVSMEDLTNMVIWIIGGDKLAVGDALYFSSLTAGKESVADDVIAKFESDADLNQVSLYWPDPQTLTIDTTVKYEGEAASLKFTYNQEQNWNYLILSAPVNCDMSKYDYIAFYVYNPTEHAFQIQPAWGTAVDVAANGWTLVKISLAEFAEGKIADMDGATLSANNITNTPLVIYGTGFVTGESIYFSSIFGIKA